VLTFCRQCELHAISTRHALSATKLTTHKKGVSYLLIEHNYNGAARLCVVRRPRCAKQSPGVPFVGEELCPVRGPGAIHPRGGLCLNAS